MKLDLTKINTAISSYKVNNSIVVPDNQRVFLLDLSGSMLEKDAGERYGTKRRIDVLMEVCAEHPNENKIGFNDRAFDISNNYIPFPKGGTNLDRGLHYCNLQSYKHVILISDGEPTCDINCCIDEVKQLTKLDIIYAGPQPAPPFLTDLAAACNNVSHHDCSFSLPKQLSQTVRGLIAAPSKQRVIKL